MTLRHLKIFVTVADCGKMRQAAEILYVSQPTISQAIAELENYCGIKLFERLSKRIYLTEQGQQLLGYARHIVQSYDTMDMTIKHLGDLPVLRLGGSVSVATRYFDELSTAMETAIPKLDMRVVINNTEFIEKLLLKSELDLAIVEGIVQEKEIIQTPIVSDELVIVVGHTHPFYTRESIQLKELEGQNYIAREDGSTLRNQYEKLLMDHSIQLVQKWCSSNTETIKKVVIAGKGFAIMSRLIIEEEQKSGLLKVVPVEGIHVKREIHLIYHKDKYISPQMKTLIELAKQMVKPE